MSSNVTFTSETNMFGDHKLISQLKKWTVERSFLLNICTIKHIHYNFTVLQYLIYVWINPFSMTAAILNVYIKKTELEYKYYDEIITLLL